MNMIGYAVHLITNAVHLSGALDVLYMIVSTVHLMANAVHPSGAPEVHLMQYTCTVHSAVYLMANIVHPSVALDVRDCICSTLDGKRGTPK